MVSSAARGEKVQQQSARTSCAVTRAIWSFLAQTHARFVGLGAAAAEWEGVPMEQVARLRPKMSCKFQDKGTPRRLAASDASVASAVSRRR